MWICFQFHSFDKNFTWGPGGPGSPEGPTGPRGPFSPVDPDWPGIPFIPAGPLKKQTKIKVKTAKNPNSLIFIEPEP